MRVHPRAGPGGEGAEGGLEGKGRADRDKGGTASAEGSPPGPGGNQTAKEWGSSGKGKLGLEDPGEVGHRSSPGGEGTEVETGRAVLPGTSSTRQAGEVGEEPRGDEKCFGGALESLGL